MAPIRRYLRITKYSVLECRIYLDNPALAESWLLNSRNPILPRVIESVRPLVLPKLREENERSRGKGNSKKRGVKDVVVEEDFEVSIFLTETSARHSLLTKQKHFHDPNKKGIQSNSSKLTGDTNDDAIHVENEPAILREDSDDDVMVLKNIPAAPVAMDSHSDAGSLFVSEDEAPRRSKRPRAATTAETGAESSPVVEPLTKRRKEDNDLFVGDDDDEVIVAEEETDDKKKMAMNTTYNGFSIYGRVLCLIIKRIDKKGKHPAVVGGQAMMEDWIVSTQLPPDAD